MASNSGRRYGSSGLSGPRKRVVIGADETVRVRYHKNQPQVEAERRSTPRQNASAASKRAGVDRRSPSPQARRLSAAKREERERRQQVGRLKRAGLGVLAILAVVAGVIGLVTLYRAPIFRVENVIVTGTRHLDSAAVLKRADLPENATLIRLPVADIQRRIEADPWVARATIDRDFPDTVRISVVERVPAVVVDAGGTDLWVVAADGFWLGKRSGEETGVVVVRDIETVKPVAGKKSASKELLNAIRIATGISEKLRSKTRMISAPTIDKTALITNDDVEIYIGEAVQLQAKDRVAREILAREKGRVVYINVRVVDRPTWRGLEVPE